MNINRISNQNFNGLWYKGTTVPAYSFTFKKNGKEIPAPQRCFVNAYYPYADESIEEINKKTRAYKDNNGMFHVAIIAPRLNFTKEEFYEMSYPVLMDYLDGSKDFYISRERENEFNLDDYYEASLRRK